jgi:hypothetical protein
MLKSIILSANNTRRHILSLKLINKFKLHLPLFFIAFSLRAIPELIIPQYPVGYETITYYAPPMFRFSELSLFDLITEFFRSGPLLYVLLWFSHTLSGAHPFFILKAFGPLLYGCLAVSFLVFQKRGLSMNEQMAFVGVLLLIFQVAALRIAWDRFRNLLGLVFVFIALTALKSNYRHKWWLMGVAAVLTVFSREYVAFVLFVAVLGFAVLEKRYGVAALVSLAPALVIFAILVYPARLWWSYIPNGGPPFVSRNYLELVRDVFSIFVVCYLPLLFFIVRGFGRDGLLDPMFGWLLFGSFSVVVSPWFAVPGYQRWLMLLVFPFVIYAVMGLDRFRLFDRSNFRKLAAVVLTFMIIGLGYSSGIFSYVWVLDNSWVPVDLVQSSIAWEHVDDVKGILKWLDENAISNSSVLAEERFYGWTLIFLRRADDDVKVIAYGANSLPQPALERALNDGFRWIYLIWYTDSNVEDFRLVYSQNSVSVFRYEG